MQHSQEANFSQATAPGRDRRRRNRHWILLGLMAALLLLVLFNFVPFHLTSSQTQTSASLGTGRSGETLPANMAPGFTLDYQVTGPDELATAVREALPDALAATSVGEATAVAALNATDHPRLLIVVDVVERVWTPVYGRAHVTANVYFASAADVPWDEAMVLTESPEIQAEGEFSVEDTSWGLLSKPAYTQMLAQALANEMAARLQADVFQRPGT